MHSEAARSSTSPFLHPQRVDSDDRPFGTQFPTNIHSLSVGSSEYLSGVHVQSLLSSPSHVAVARSFEGTKAQIFINFLDQVLFQLRLAGKLQQRCLRLIRKISNERKIIPTSYVLQEDCIHVGPVQYRGGFSDVSNGEYQGCTVAIKHLKMNQEDSDTTFKRLCREIITWKHLTHPNILPLLGVSISADTRCFRILTQWMPNGNIIQYAKSNPAANRLKLLSEVMSAMTYLHDLGIIHGDLKGANILIDNTGAALVADFGLMTMIDLSTFLSETVDPPGGTWRWMSPELFDPESFGSNGRLTRGSDRYALGMVIYEVLTGLKPFYNMPDFTCIIAIVRGKRPPKPPHAESLGFSNTLWVLTQSCWSETTSARPTAQQLLDCISLASPTWAPPAVYPVVAGDPPSLVDSESTNSEDIPYGFQVRRRATCFPAGLLVILVVVVFLFLSVISVLFSPIFRHK